jgi:hypothetical protein
MVKWGGSCGASPSSGHQETVSGSLRRLLMEVFGSQ